MQQSKQRDLASFAPFRADEMIEDKFTNSRTGAVTYAYFPNLGGRLRVAREKYPDLVIETTKQDFLRREYAIVYAHVGIRSQNFHATAYGYADKESDARLADSLLELAESRAVTRALRYLGIGVEYNGAEEVDGRAKGPINGAEQPRSNVTSLKPHAATRPTQPGHETERQEAERTGKPTTTEVATGRAAIGAHISELVGGDRAKGVGLMNAILPGWKNVASTTDDQLWRVQIALGLMRGCGNDLAKAKVFCTEQLGTPWVDKMNDHAKNAAIKYLKTGVLPYQQKPAEDKDDVPF